jgi:hypothetical protein
MSKLHEKPSVLKREHPALQKMKFTIFFMFVGHCSPPGSGSRDPIESGFTALAGTIGTVASIIYPNCVQVLLHVPEHCQGVQQVRHGAGKVHQAVHGRERHHQERVHGGRGIRALPGPRDLLPSRGQTKVIHLIKIQAIFNTVVNPDPDLVD